jgi:hypothetical protein
MDCPHIKTDWNPPMPEIAKAARNDTSRVWGLIFGGDVQTDTISIDVECLDCGQRFKQRYKKEEE